jgi:inhibitor of cysteine peptidase
LLTRSEARVGRVEVLVLESFPLQIQVVAYGVLASSCDSLVGSNVTLAGNRFDITLWQESILAPCLPLTEPFETVIDLDAWGLAAGDYVVDVNGVQSTFNVPVDNIAVDNIPELCGDDCTPATNQP